MPDPNDETVDPEETATEISPEMDEFVKAKAEESEPLIVPDDVPNAEDGAALFDAQPVVLVGCKKCCATNLDPHYVLEPGVKRSSLRPAIGEADQATQMAIAGAGDLGDAEVKLRSLYHLRDCGNPVTE